MKDHTNNIIRVHGFIGLLLGVPMGAIGASLMKHGSFGLTPFYSVSLALHEVTRLFTMGTWNTVFQVLLVLTLVILTRKVAVRYLLSFLVAVWSSVILDLSNTVTATFSNDIFTRILCFIFGFLILGIGISLLARCKMPVAPMNLFPRELAEIYHRKFKEFKLWFDIGCLAFTLIISFGFVHKLVGCGIGTFISVLTGPLTGIIINWLDKHFEFYK